MDFIAPFVLRRKNNAIKAIALLLALVCLVGSLSQTAQAENTFVITDGDDVTVHTTYTSDPATALKEAGVDEAVLELKKYEALVQMSNGKASKLIVPTDAVNAVKANVMFAETTGLGDVTASAEEAE